jgi:hypothetical protein
METVLAVAVGLGLAAASGLRVFLPLFVLGVAAATGTVPVAEGWSWVGSQAALIGLGTAMVLEIGAYYVPWLDQALDVIATPAAVIAGMIASASVLVDVPPMLKWAIVIIGGGGIAGLTQGASVLTRFKSSTLTGGLGNPVVATGELIGSVLLALLAVLLPIVGLVVATLLLVWLLRRAWRARAVRTRAPASAFPST